MLELVEWGEFRLGGLFDIVGTKSLDSNAIDFKNTGINFIGRTFENNGIQGKIEERDFPPNEASTITATVIGNYKYVKYQKDPYYCSQNINKLTPKQVIYKWNKNIACFFMTNIQKFVSLYDNQQGGYKLDDIRNHIIKLPIKNGKIDFEFMDKFIAELEKNHLKEEEYRSERKINAYLQVTGLKNYELTSDELKVLKEFEDGKMDWREFKVGGDNGLFTIHSSKKRFDANKVKVLDYGNPYIVRTANNNGLRGYLDEDEQFLNDGNTISFGQDTATMFYQERPYFTGDKIKIIKSKDHKFGKSNAHFFITSMGKSFSSFARGQSSFSVKIIENQHIYLPIKDNQPDYNLMETFISAIHKLVIKDVVLYNQERLKATAQVINKKL